MPNEINEVPGNNAMRASRAIEPVGDRPGPMCQEKEYHPPRREMLKEHEINITFFNVGCMVRVGCKNIAFNSTEEAMKEVTEYVANPRESVKKWSKIFNANE